ncbi:amidase signature domain-containing protein [Aspergillus ambiguus]|uniref:amidase signature domain-containing protein n=1 Tax=Aspergillus ambiguus TaxID=176160 RepID=UPI003CCE4234
MTHDSVDEKPGHTWETVVSRKRREQQHAIKEFTSTYVNSTETVDNVAICDLPHERLKDLLSRGELQAETVTIAYITRAIKAHQKTNCLTEILFADAVNRARELDDHFRKFGKPLGPLHGIPVSLKDQFDVCGLDSSLGYVGRAFSPRDEDAAVVTIMRQLGAVIIAKTNIPQSIMVSKRMAETDNPLWGLTVNPRDSTFTPGGSSGGESALIASHGSLIGWGTDIGGSIRSPSSMMGLYGLKPSHGRLPYYNVSVSTEGQEHVPSVVGPMARSLFSLTEVTKSVIDSEPWAFDPRCVPIPWRSGMYQDMLSRPLTIGLITDDGVVRPHPPIRRALQLLAEKLQRQGHEVIPWDTTGHADFIAVQDQYYTADGGEDIRRDIAVCNEPFLPYVKALVDRGAPISVYQYWQLNRQKVAHQKIWVGYTKVWNFLDYPALAFPVTTVSKETDLVDSGYEPRNAMDEWNWKLYDPERMDGHPVGLQIIARKMEEERVLGAARVFENALTA